MDKCEHEWTQSECCYLDICKKCDIPKLEWERNELKEALQKANVKGMNRLDKIVEYRELVNEIVSMLKNKKRVCEDLEMDLEIQWINIVLKRSLKGDRNQ